jgi:hypothetical protein
MGLLWIPVAVTAFAGLAVLFFFLLDVNPLLALGLVLTVGGALVYVFGWFALVLVAMMAAKPACECVCVCFVCDNH